MVQQEAADAKPCKERRTFPRVPLDAPVFVTLSVQNQEARHALLVECSRGGMQLVLAPENALPEMLNASVLILGLPPSLDASGSGLPGSISWASAERCGIRFHSPLTLSEAVLQSISQSI